MVHFAKHLILLSLCSVWWQPSVLCRGDGSPRRLENRTAPSSCRLCGQFPNGAPQPTESQASYHWRCQVWFWEQQAQLTKYLLVQLCSIFQPWDKNVYIHSLEGTGILKIPSFLHPTPSISRVEKGWLSPGLREARTMAVKMSPPSGALGSSSVWI